MVESKQSFRSHYRAPDHPDRWEFQAWTWRRAVKIGETTNIGDILKCYENMPQGIYQHNLKLFNSWGTGCGEHAIIRPEHVISLLMPKTTNRESIGGGMAKKQRRVAPRRVTTKVGRSAEKPSQASSETRNSQSPRIPSGKPLISEPSHAAFEVFDAINEAEDEEDDWVDVDNVETATMTLEPSEQDEYITV